MALPPLKVDLDLSELNELNEVIEHAKTKMIKRGKPFHKDPKRGHRLIGIVRKYFRALGPSVQFNLGNGAHSQRFLKAAFAWGLDPDVGGVSAKGITRSKLGKFNQMGADRGSRVTGYVFEGPLGGWIVSYLGGRAANVNNIFAAVIAHELGHQLGLSHEKSENDVMFGFGAGSRAQRTTWLRNAEKTMLNFTPAQISTMQKLLATP